VNKKDIEFLKVLIQCLELSGFKPPYEFSQRGIRNNVRNFYEYSSDKSVHDKFRQFLQQGLLVQNQFCFQLTEKALWIVKQNK